MFLSCRCGSYSGDFEREILTRRRLCVGEQSRLFFQKSSALLKTTSGRYGVWVIFDVQAMGETFMMYVGQILFNAINYAFRNENSFSLQCLFYS